MSTTLELNLNTVQWALDSEKQNKHPNWEYEFFTCFLSEYENDDGISFWRFEMENRRRYRNEDNPIKNSTQKLFDAILVELIVLWWKIENKTKHVHPYD